MAPLFALAWLRTRGRFAWLGSSVVALGTVLWIAWVGRGLAVSRAYDAREALVFLPLLSAKAMLWGPGILTVVICSLHAWRRDREEGVADLAVRSGHAAPLYYRARTWVLAGWLLGVQVLAGMLLFAVLVGTNASTAQVLLRGSVPAAAYAIVGSVLLALLGSVCLGPRTRPGGYLLLALLLFVPESLSRWTAGLLGQDMTSLPALLHAVALSLGPSQHDAARFARAALVLLLVFGLLVAWLRYASQRWSRQP